MVVHRAAETTVDMVQSVVAIALAVVDILAVADMECMVLDSISLVAADRVAAQSLVVADRSIVEIVHSLLVVVAAYVFLQYKMYY